MKVEIEIETEELEALAREVFQNYPEYSHGNTLVCTRWKYEAFDYGFKDTKTGRMFALTLDKAVKGLEKFIMMVLTGQLHFDGLSDVRSLLDAACYDADSLDAVTQLALLGEVVYC